MTLGQSGGWWLSLMRKCWNWCAGRHRCSQCDYTVDRQHILEYHVKNVHVAGVTAAPTNATGDRQETTSSDHSDEETAVVDAEPASRDTSASSSGTDPAVPVKCQRMRRGVDTAEQVMTVAAYRCVSCGYRCHSVGTMARHRLRHSAWSLPHGCGQCQRRTTTRRLLTQHAMKAHDETPRRTVGGDVQSSAHPPQHGCSQLPNESSSASDLAADELFYAAGLRRYRCPHCSFSVDRRRLLIRHRRLHCRTTGPPLRCPHADCPFACHDRVQLTSHRRQHAAAAGRRPAHPCDRCSFAADSRNALLHHRRLHDRRHRRWPAACVHYLGPPTSCITTCVADRRRGWPTNWTGRVLHGGQNYDSILIRLPVRRPFDCLSKVIKFTVT